MPRNDDIDIGVFSGRKEHEQQLCVKKAHPAAADLEIVVDQLPTRAGIDPYNKLIDPISDDNEIDVPKPLTTSPSAHQTHAV